MSAQETQNPEHVASSEKHDQVSVAGKLRNFDSHIVTAFMDHLVMSKYQTRIFGYEDRKGLEELAFSIRANGLISRPIVVPHTDPRKAKEGFFELVTGHRRCSAIKMFMPEVKSAEFQCLDSVSQLVVMKIVADDNLQRRQLKTYEEGKLYMIGKKILKCDVPKLSEFFNKAQDRVATCLQIAATMDEVLDEQEGIKDAVELRNNIVKNMKEPHLALVTQVKDKSDRLELLKMIADNKPMVEITGFAKASVINRKRLRMGRPHNIEAPQDGDEDSEKDGNGKTGSAKPKKDEPPTPTYLGKQAGKCIEYLAERKHLLPSDMRERIEFLEKLDVARAIKEMYEREEQIVKN